jgi:hypothetical protein
MIALCFEIMFELANYGLWRFALQPQLYIRIRTYFSSGACQLQCCKVPWDNPLHSRSKNSRIGVSHVWVMVVWPCSWGGSSLRDVADPTCPAPSQQPAPQSHFSSKTSLPPIQPSASSGRPRSSTPLPIPPHAASFPGARPLAPPDFRPPSVWGATRWPQTGGPDEVSYDTSSAPRLAEQKLTLEH